jgi:uncharacterized protein (DUF983 family)
MEKSSADATDILFIGVFCVFLGLKLSNHIDWSWWWVTAPIWIPYFAIPIVALLVIGFIRAAKGSFTLGLAYVAVLAFVLWYIHNFII